MIGTEIPQSLLDVIVGGSFTAVIMLVAWIVRELSRVAQTMARMDEKQTDFERRLEIIEHHPK